jgi:hypothetical protein
MPSWAKVLKDRTERRQESLGVTCRFKPLHATFALTRRPMRVLTTVVEVAALAVFYTRQNLTFGRPVALEFVGNHHTRDVMESLEQLAEKLLGCLAVTSALHEDVEDIVALIHGPPQVIPLAIDRQKNLIEMPLITGAWPPAAYLIGGFCQVLGTHIEVVASFPSWPKLL